MVIRKRLSFARLWVQSPYAAATHSEDNSDYRYPVRTCRDERSRRAAMALVALRIRHRMTTGRSSGAGRLRTMAAIIFRNDLDFDEKVQQCLAMGCDDLGATSGMLVRVDGQTSFVEHVVSARAGAQVGLTSSLFDALFHATLEEDGVLAIDHVGPSYRSHSGGVASELETYIGDILWVRGRKYGTLCFTSATSRTRPFTDEDRDHVRFIALWAGSELERQVLARESGSREQYSRLLTATARKELLAEIGLAIRTSTDADGIEVRAAVLLGSTLAADRCFFVHLELERDYMRFAPGWCRPDLQTITGEYKPSALQIDMPLLFAQGASLVIDDMAGGPMPAASVETLNSLQISALIAVPIFCDDRLEAVLFVAMVRPRTWTNDERLLVEAVAVLARTSIEASDIIRRERRIATTLQDALLPPLPADVPGMRLGYTYRAALDESKVGGDFFAAYALDEHRYALIIGDVSGKGLAAASQVAALQNILRYALVATESLAGAITQMNSAVIAHRLLAGFATIFVGIYDVDLRTLTYCSCGHEPALIMAVDSVNSLLTAGLPLGVTESVPYEEQCVQLALGDMLVLYTDGLSEAGPDRRLLLGSEGLVELVRRHRNDGPAGEIAEAVMADVVTFANGHLHDDACLIIAELVERTLPHEPGFQEDKLRTRSGVHQRVREAPIAEQFRLLIDGISDYAIFLLDTGGYIVTWNKGAVRLKGYTAPEIVGKHFSIFYTPEDIQRGHPQEELAITAANGRYEEEGWRVRKDGTRFWANVVITALRYSDGSLCGFGKLTRDFTDRRNAEQEVRRSEERFRLLVQGVQDYAIFMLDLQGVIISWNEGAQRIKGYSAGEAIGQHFSIFYTPEDVAQKHPAHELALATAEGRYEEEGWRVRKDGTRFWANVVITSLKDEAGNQRGFAKVTRDFSDRRAAEAAHLQTLRDQISRTFLRDILYSVTEGRLRFCEVDSQLPERLPCRVDEQPFDHTNLASIRRAVTMVAEEVGLTELRLSDLITAASEATMNAVVHAHNSYYSLCANETTVQVWIADHASGIELSTLHRATLERGFTTENSLGHGFWLMLHTSDRLWLRSSSSGTIIVLEQDATAPESEWLSRPRDLAYYLPHVDDGD
jgi:PAS domain S-box-containing protein